MSNPHMYVAFVNDPETGVHVLGIFTRREPAMEACEKFTDELLYMPFEEWRVYPHRSYSMNEELVTRQAVLVEVHST